MNLTAKEFWVDGGCTGNGSEDAQAYGSISDGDTVMRQDWPLLKTNNEAEYATLIWLLALLHGNSTSKGPIIWTDSKLMVGHLTLDWKVKAENLRKYFEMAERLLNLTGAQLKWVSRDEIVKRLGH